MRSTSYFIATMGLVAATIATTIGAQPPGPPPGGRGLGAPGGPGDIERLTILLDLDTYQKGEVERVLKEQRAAFVAEREAAQASGEKPLYQPRTSPDKVREDTLTKLQSVLTPQQLEKFKVLTERPGPGPGRRGPPPAPGAE